MEGFVGMVILLGIIFYFMCAPVDTNSSSYKIGRGIGNKTRKFGEWLTRDD